MFVSGGSGGHLIVNCDGHDDYDPTSAQGQGQNADGFGVHYQTSGPTTVVRGCRSWWNSDDGYDLINQEVPVIVEGSWAMGNGYANAGTTSPASGNGNGFKMGSSKTGVRHIVRNNVAWKNKAAGFYANHSGHRPDRCRLCEHRGHGLHGAAERGRQHAHHRFHETGCGMALAGLTLLCFRHRPRRAT